MKAQLYGKQVPSSVNERCHKQCMQIIRSAAALKIKIHVFLLLFISYFYCANLIVNQAKVKFYMYTFIIIPKALTVDTNR